MSDRISDADLEVLIVSLQAYKRTGVIDPWVYSDGHVVDPLDVLLELRDLRGAAKTT